MRAGGAARRVALFRKIELISRNPGVGIGIAIGVDCEMQPTVISIPNPIPIPTATNKPNRPASFSCDWVCYRRMEDCLKTTDGKASTKWPA
jgi:hypothetical protein